VKSSLFRSTAIAALLGLAAATAAQAQTIPSDAAPNCPVSTTEFSSWFLDHKPSTDGVVTPANSIKLDTSVNCNFYEWSERMFLWLTSPSSSGHIFEDKTFYQVVPLGDTGSLRFLSLAESKGKLQMRLRAAQPDAHGLQVIFDKDHVAHEVIPAQKGKPMVRDSVTGKMKQVTGIAVMNGAAMIHDAAGRPIKPKFSFKPELTVNGASPVQEFIVGGKTVYLDAGGNPVVPDQGQAGSTEGVLIAQNKSLVYYTTHVNDVYAWYLTQQSLKNGLKPPTNIQFPVSTEQVAPIVEYALKVGHTVIPDPEALAMELKASWVEVSDAQAPNFITIKATVPDYIRTEKEWKLTTKTRNVTLGLIGLHVVGSAHNHPEMLWSTFEHFGNAPNVPYSYVNNATPPQIVKVSNDTAGPWMFCQMNCPATSIVQLAKLDDTTGNIIQPPGSTAAIGPSDTLRLHPWGAATNTAPNALVKIAAQSNSDVISVNSSVLGQLVGQDVRKNYFFVGSTWADSGATPANPYYGAIDPGTSPPPPPSSPGNEVGTSQISNTTMETYQQGSLSSSYYSISGNCFDCHQSNQVTVSHIWTSLKPLPVITLNKTKPAPAKKM
jgi:hypothetical protein